MSSPSEELKLQFEQKFDKTFEQVLEINQRFFSNNKIDALQPKIIVFRWLITDSNLMTNWVPDIIDVDGNSAQDYQTLFSLGERYGQAGIQVAAIFLSMEAWGAEYSPDEYSPDVLYAPSPLPSENPEREEAIVILGGLISTTKKAAFFPVIREAGYITLGTQIDTDEGDIGAYLIDSFFWGYASEYFEAISGEGKTLH